MVAPAGPCLLVAGGEQRADLGIGEVGDQVAFGALAGMASTRWMGAGVPGV